MTIPEEFTNRVANLSGDTARMLESIILPALEEEGYVTEVDLCQQFIEKHRKLAYDCAVITQNIEPRE